MKKASPFLLALVLAPGLFAALSPEEVAVKVESRLRALATLQADFEQTYFSTSLATPLREKGKFYFKKPGWMRWEYQDPEKNIFVYKEGLALYYFPEDNQLYRLKGFRERVESEILSLLSGQRNLAENYTIEFSPFPSENLPAWQLKLSPREESEYSFILLEIDQKSSLIQKAIFMDWGGNKQEFRFDRIKTGQPLSPALFELKVPPGCEVIEGEPEQIK